MAELTVPRVDFSSLGELPTIIRQNQADALRRQTLASLGQGGTADADALLRSGDLSLAQLGVGLRNRAADDAWRREEAARTQQNADRSYRLQERAASRADRGIEETAADRAAAARSYGIDPATPQGKAFILTGKLPEGDINFQSTIEHRKAAAVANGLDPSSPGFQSYVLTGKMPREDAQPLTATDKKAILEADEGVMTNKAVITALDEAAKLSPQTNTGVGASFRAKIGNVLPDAMVPDAVSSPKSSAATANYENLVLGQALTQLKSTFGAAPTEGERKILLELQASVDKPDSVRQDVLRRARALAENRLRFNEQRASELRGGSFYKANKTAAAPAASGQGSGADIMLQQARDAIAAGAPRAAVIQRLQGAGIDPSAL
jgi:hypothetical protein